MNNFLRGIGCAVVTIILLSIPNFNWRMLGFKCSSIPMLTTVPFDSW